MFNIMSDKKTQLRELLQQLETLVKKMDVPVYRRNNVCWLKRHLGVKNSSHPYFMSVMKIVEELLSHGVGHG